MTFSSSQINLMIPIALLILGLLCFYASAINFVSMIKRTYPYETFSLIKRKYLASYMLSYLLLIPIGYRGIEKVKSSRLFLYSLFYLTGFVLFFSFSAFQLWYTNVLYENKFQIPFLIVLTIVSMVIAVQISVFYSQSDRH